MTESERNTAYCGLFCCDCIPSNRAFFDCVNALSCHLCDLGFEHYAALKARRKAVFRSYDAFTAVLEAIGGLQCSHPCREGGGSPNCRVRKCCLSKSYAGCWECASFRECELLQPLRDFHGENISHNLEMIRRDGIAGWSGERGKHYPWS